MLVSTVVILPMIFSLAVPAGIIFADENGSSSETATNTNLNLGSFPIDPKGSILYANVAPPLPDNPNAATFINLDQLATQNGFDTLVGRTLIMSVEGNMCYFAEGGPEECELIPVEAILGSFTVDTTEDVGAVNPLPGAIAATELSPASNAAYNYPNTWQDDQSTAGGPPDFSILKSSPLTVVVPTGAHYLAVAVNDSYYADNTDRDGTLKINIQVVVPTENPSNNIPNIPPTITLVGANPLEIAVDTLFVDPGATAADTEDGDLTSQIITNGSVNTSVEGSYTITYSVSDSQGASISVNRVVVVDSEIISYSCMLPDSLGDSVVITPGASSSGEKPLQQLLNDEGFTNTVGSDQNGYQIWNTSNSSTTIEIQFIDQGAHTANGNLVGYYTNGDKATFVPLFRTNNNSHPSYAGLPVFSKGQKISVNVLDASNLSFAIVSQAPNSLEMFSTEISKNNDSKDHVIAFDAKNSSGLIANTYILAFEDLVGGGDSDYDDVVVQVKVVACGSKDVVPTTCDPNINLIKNGSFESPVISSDKEWETFPMTNPDIGWQASWVSSLTTFNGHDRPTVTTLEFQKVGAAGVTPVEGNQSAELDADWEGNIDAHDPAGTPSSIAIFQDVQTNSNYVYELSYYFTARPGYDASENFLGVYVDNSQIDTHATSSVLWTKYVNSFVANDSATRVEFRDLGTPNALGTMLDNVVLRCVGPKPVNTPPTITLVGANPFNMTVGTVFTDPGATADDLEDGNLTSQIVRTGSINASTTGTYVLTYVVKDSGNLYATTTRTVNVNPVGDSNSPAVTLTANPSSITVGATSTLTWTSTNTNSCSAVWTTATSTSGSKDVAPGVTTEYSISCTGTNGTVSATTTVTVTSVPPVNPPGGGGGGGGGSLSGGRRHPVVVGEILGATSCLYLIDYIKIDWVNDPIEVLKVQSFLNVFEKESLSLTGVYNQATFDAVVRFQNKYASDILTPWGDKVTTGFVYILTKKKINEIYCNTIYPLSQGDQNEIDIFRNSDGVSSVNGNTGINSGVDVGTNGRNLGTLLGDSVDSIADNISNVLNGSAVVELKDSGKSALRNAAISLFSLPQRMFDRLFDGCGYTPTLLFLILIALVIIIIKLFANSVRGNEPKSPMVGTPNTSTTANVVKDSPVIILPGVMPDEEIIIENPEEGPDDVLVNTPDLRPDQNKKS